MRDVVVVSGVRTAIGGFGGGLMNVPVVDLGAVVMKDVLKRISLKPVAGTAAMDFAPDKLQDQGMIDLEKKSYDWSGDAAEVAEHICDPLQVGAQLRVCNLPITQQR